MTIAGFAILVVLVLIGIAIFVELARLPGKKARERDHPQADAINVLGWVGLLLGVAPWLVALVWAYTRPPLLVASQMPAAVAEPVTNETKDAGE
jgi:hypothetical protein